NWLPPCLVVAVPLGGLAQTRLELDGGLPAQLVTDLRPVERVTAIVAGAVGDDLLQRGRLAERVEHTVCDLLDRTFDAGPDVIRLADHTIAQHHLDRAAVVYDVNPLPAVLGRRVQRQRLVGERSRR